MLAFHIGPLTFSPCRCVTHMQEALAAKSKAEEAAALLFAKKKSTAQERKAKKEQKDEAERHIAAQEALVGAFFILLLVAAAAAAASCCKHTALTPCLVHTAAWPQPMFVITPTCHGHQCSLARVLLGGSVWPWSLLTDCLLLMPLPHLRPSSASTTSCGNFTTCSRMRPQPCSSNRS